MKVPGLDVPDDSPQLHTADKPKPKPIEDWWRETAASDFKMVWFKARDYGDLTLMAVHAGSIETVLAFYALGKLQRILNQLERGAIASQDSWRDLVCYAMMARRVSETGSWPA